MKLRRNEIKRARIEIIPMIDTIFFLLVFFIITSLSQVQMSAKRVALPVSATAESKPSSKVVLTVDDRGNYYVDRLAVPAAEILPRLQARVNQDAGVVVVINCDKSEQVAQFQYALDMAHRANPASLMIATTPKTSAGSFP